MPNDYRSLLLDLAETHQIVGVVLPCCPMAHTASVVKVGADYAVFHLLSTSEGGVFGMPVVRLADIHYLDLRIAARETEGPDRETADMVQS